jgi:ATP-binding cassette subfamily C protein LapB
MLELLRCLAIRPGLTTELVAASLLANLLALAPPLFVIQVLNRCVAHGVDATLLTLTTGALIAIALEFGFRQIRHRLARGVSAGQDDKLSVSGFGVLISAKSGALDRLRPGQQREFMRGLDTIRAAYCATNVAAVLDLPFAFLFLGLLAVLSPLLAIIAAVFTGLAFFAGLAVMVSIRGTNKRLIEETRKSNLLVGSAIGEKDTLRAFNAGAFLLKAWHTQARVIHEISRRVTGRQGLMASFTTSTVALMSAAIMATGAIMVVGGSLDVGVLIGANILSARALQPVTRFVQVGESFQKARQAAQQLREFMKLPRESETGSAKRDYEGTLEFRDLRFVYDGAAGPLFESLPVSIPAGAVAVVTGANGTGKSTLARLVMGLLDPSRGPDPRRWVGFAPGASRLVALAVDLPAPGARLSQRHHRRKSAPAQSGHRRCRAQPGHRCRRPPAVSRRDAGRLRYSDRVQRPQSGPRRPPPAGPGPRLDGGRQAGGPG